MAIDLSKCKKGDILISSHGFTLEYVAPIPWGNYYYLDHVVRYVKDAEGNPFQDDSYSTRTNDGFVYKFKRQETDHDIVEVIPV